MIEAGDYVKMKAGAISGYFRVVKARTDISIFTASQEFWLERLSFKQILIFKIKSLLSKIHGHR